nr:MAG TPA: hypothetical protein [Caudoviricetes sp.]
MEDTEKRSVVSESEKHGILQISNEADRMTVSSILFKNGYSITPVRRKKGRSKVYFIRYDQIDNIDEEAGENDS